MLRKFSFLIAFCLAVLPIYAQTSSGGGGLAYAYNQTSGNLECFSLDGFTSFQTLHTIGDDVRAGAFVEGEYYALRYENSYPVEIAAYNLATGNKRSVMPTTTVYRDMAYDYSTQTLLLLEYNPDLSTNSLMRLDLESGEITKVCDFEYNMAAVAADIDGSIYAVDNWGDIYGVDTDAGSASKVYGFSVNLYSSGSYASLDFDYNTGKLYLLAYSNSYIGGGCSLYLVDVEAQSNTKLGNTLNNTYIGLYTGYTKATPDTPAAPAGLAITSAADGSNGSTLSWTCPTTAFNRQEIGTPTHATVYRDGVAVGTVKEVAAGSKATYTDNVPAAGTYTYKVTLSNEAGEGMFAIATEYVGKDVPAAPTNVVATVEDYNIAITWTAPTTGLNGGSLSDDVTYKVVRNDGKVIAESATDTSVKDVVEGEYAVYTYTVTAKNSAGEGGSATSNAVGAGDALDFPLTTAFSSAEDLRSWTIIDADGDGNTWQMGNKWGNKEGIEVYHATANDEWLISPPVSLAQDVPTRISFFIYCTYYCNENIEVRIAERGTSPEEATTVNTISIQGSKGYYGTTVSLDIPTVAATGEYCIYLHYTGGYGTDGMHINDFSWKANNTATISGTVTNPMDMGMYGVTVKVGELSATTDWQGKYTIAEVPAGECDVIASYPTYRTVTKHVSLNVGDNVTVDFAMELLPEYEVSGTVTDETGAPVKGARVSLTGYESVSATTNAEGKYTLETYEATGYTLSVLKNNYISPQPKQIDLTQDFSGEDFTLEIDILPSYKISAADNAEGTVAVTWDKPRTINEMSYDNGVPADGYGYGAYFSGAQIVGTVFPGETTLYELKWWTVGGEGCEENITLMVIDLNWSGEPTGDVLYQVNVNTVDGEWNTFRLPEPLYAEKGFLFAIAGKNNVATDAGTADGTIDHPHTQVYTQTYNAPSSYGYFDELSNPSRHLLLRVMCENVEPDDATMPAITYDVWRLPASAQGDESKWMQIVPGSEALSATDTDVKSGEYRYAVKAVYGTIGASEATISDVVAHNMIANVVVNVSADSDPAHANGAAVKLYNDEHSYTATVADGVAEFAGVYKGLYSITIRQNGFKFIEDGGLDIQGEDITFTESYELEQTLDLPANLDVMVDGRSARLMWNMPLNIVENYDGDDYIDFEVNPAGNYGWQYVDGDYMITYGFANTSFPHMGERMAAITFNSQATTPPLSELGGDANTARSGDRALAFFATKATTDEEGGITYYLSDDYLISPELKPYRDFTFSFYARQYNHQLNDDNSIDYSRTERIRVGYATERPAANLSNIQWIDEELRRVESIEYEKYEYDIPQQAKYVVLNSSSNDAFMLLVDDVFIGVEEQVQGNSYMPVNVEGYEVYLNDEKKFDTNDTEYTFTDLADGTYTAAVVQKFAMGNSEKLSITFNIGNSGVEGLEADDVLGIYVYGDVLHVDGEYSRAGIYSTSGAQVMTLAGEQTADISALPRGVYIVKVVKADGSDTTAKIIK